MITSGLVGLRARVSSDTPVLHAELYNDVETRSRADTRPWRPIDAESDASPFAAKPPAAEFAAFAVVELVSDELAGEAVMWRIDTHNRNAHLGVSLRPAFRGRGLGTDVVRALCRYGFWIRGLHRLQLETLSDNTAMIHAAQQVGFAQEGVLRQAAWVSGRFADEVLFGLLAADYRP